MVDKVVVVLLLLVLEKTSLDQINKVSQVVTSLELMDLVVVAVPVVLEEILLDLVEILHHQVLVV